MLIQNRKLIYGIIIGLFFANILSWIAVYDLKREHFLEVNFFDVGQGEAIFIETPEFRQILIDGGPSSIILEKLGKEMPFWDRTIDLLILTHPESDHLVGLLEVLKKYKVKNILWTGVKRNTAEYGEWLGLLKKEKGNVFLTQAGKRVIASETILEVLFPLESPEKEELKDSNNTSIVAKLVFGESSFLFTGDIYKSAEREILERKLNINFDVLKVGHHGSKTSNSEEFIVEVSPEIAVISAGKDNRYGHPHQEVLERLEKYGTTILRTDHDGDIKIISDGTNYKIK